MQLQRNEIMTGLLVIGTIAVVAFLLVLLGAPGLFRPLVIYKIYFDNAVGIKQGGPVMLAGRKIGQVQKLYSPVSPEEEKRAEEAAAATKPPEPNAGPNPSPTPGKPRFEVRIDVQVDKSAKVYRDAKTRMIQLGLLGDMAIDITQGTEKSGRAKDGEIFAGERTPDLGEAAAKMLEVIKPVAAEATNTMKDLQQTAQNINRLTDENSELTLALGQFKTFGQHLSDFTASATGGICRGEHARFDVSPKRTLPRFRHAHDSHTQDVIAKSMRSTLRLLDGSASPKTMRKPTAEGARFRASRTKASSISNVR